MSHFSNYLRMYPLMFQKPYYKGIGIHPTDEELKYKNPINYTIKKMFGSIKTSSGDKEYRESSFYVSYHADDTLEFIARFEGDNNCIENKHSPISSGKDGREALSLICAFHESAMNDGKKIKLPLKTSNVMIN